MADNRWLGLLSVQLCLNVLDQHAHAIVTVSGLTGMGPGFPTAALVPISDRWVRSEVGFAVECGSLERMALDDLVAVFDGLEVRAQADPRLERYRVPAGGDAILNEIPAGWFLSEAMAHLAVNGGWWPGRWLLRPGEEHSDPEDVLANGLSHQARRDRRVRWTHAGCVWEKDHFYTPLLRHPTTAAPLFGLSTQALWVSMVFPHEAALLEAFILAYDELGMNDMGEVDPFFVEWVTSPPLGKPDERTIRVHNRLLALSTGWTTDHPCWRSEVMPVMGWPEDQWSTDIKATVLGVDEQHIGF